MKPLDPGNFDDVCIDPMCHRFKSAAVAAEASLFTRLALRTTVAVDALHIVAFKTETTRCHTGNSRQDMKVLAGQFAVMVMIAAFFVRTFTKQEVIIAKFKFLQLIKVITRNAFEVQSVDTLAVLVSLHSLRGSCARDLWANNLEIRRVGFIGDCGQRNTQI